MNGFGVGEKHWGGLAQKAKVKGNWLVKLPQKFTQKQAMAIGTAGYTARRQRKSPPDSKPEIRSKSQKPSKSLLWFRAPPGS